MLPKTLETKNVENQKQKQMTLHESGLTSVTFCGQQFCAESLMELPVDAPRPPELQEFCTIVGRLETLAHDAQALGRNRSQVVFIENGKSKHFQKALQKIAHSTAWQIQFLPSKTAHGFDASVVLP